LGVRLGTALVGLLCPIFLAAAAKRPLLALWIALSMPLFSLGGMLATPDVPLMAAWSAGLWAAINRRWIVLGIAAGLAMQSKYTGLLLLPSVFIACPGELRRKGPWLSALVALLVYAPNALWNLQSGAESWLFQLSHVGQRPERGTFLLAQAGLAGPLLFAAGTVWCFRGMADRRLKICRTSFLLPIAAGIWAGGEANWAAPAYAGMAVGLASMEGRWERIAWTAVSFNIFLSGAALAHAWHPIVKLPKDPMHRLQGGRGLASSVAAWGISEIRTTRYQEAALIHFYSGIEARPLPGQGRPNHYGLEPARLPAHGLFVRPYRDSSHCELDSYGYSRSDPNEVRVYEEVESQEPRIVGRWQSYEFWRGKKPAGIE
jgi:4-amino-4-deoxy-L-arabinose transferase-like glycosyltransferase